MCEKCLSYHKGATPCLLGIEHKERKIEEPMSLQKESEWENTKKAFLKELKQALQNNIPHAVDTEFSKFLPAVETAIDTIVSTREKEIAEEVKKLYSKELLDIERFI